MAVEEVFTKREKLARVGEQITELAGHLNAGEYRFLVLVEAFDREGGWQGEGINSCAHWLNWYCGINIGVAREKVRVARALPALPQISQAFSEGRVSYSKVRAMTRVATLKNEDALLNTAHHGSAQILELEAISVIPMHPAANDFSIRWWKRDADVLAVLQGAFAPSGRKIIGSPKGYGPFSRLLCWTTGPVGPATVTRGPPCTQKNGPITGCMGITEMASWFSCTDGSNGLRPWRKNSRATRIVNSPGTSMRPGTGSSAAA